MLRKGLTVIALALCLLGTALAQEDIPYFSDISGGLPVSEDRSEADTVLQTYADVETGECAAFSVRLLESGFALTEKSLMDSGAVRMAYTREDARVLTEYFQGTLRVSCPDVRRDDIALSPAGTVVVFGAYADAPVAWIVARERDNCLLLVSEQVLEAMPYHETHEDVTWETSTLRAWLNDTFLRETFTEDEIAKLMPDEAGDTAFLLREEEAALVSVAASPTPHALSNGCNEWENGCAWYYLRDAGYTAMSASCVRHDGKIFYEDVDCPDMGVRVGILYRKGVK